jgi:hypothetical protein
MQKAHYHRGRRSTATRRLPVVYTSGITQLAGATISFGFIGISEIVRSRPLGSAN